MICRIEGILESVARDAGQVRTEGGLTYEVLLPAHAVVRLTPSVGQMISLHTVQFLESQTQGTTIYPRLAGFASEQDRAFYELFITVKGIGHRRGLRAMVMDTARIAAAIDDRDLATLQTMPEIGRRTAETIAVTLKGKVDSFVSSSVYPDSVDPPQPNHATGGHLPREALEVLLQLGESRTEAASLIDRVLREDNTPSDVQNMVQAVYRLKTGAQPAAQT